MPDNDAPQVQVNAVEEDDGGTDVLGEAAVTAAVLSGAAAAEASNASSKATAADAKADAAGNAAVAAGAEAASKPDEARVEAIVEDKLTAALSSLAEVLKPQAQPVEAAAPPPAPAEDEPPASVKKTVAKRRTFAERYMGVEREPKE